MPNPALTNPLDNEYMILTHGRCSTVYFDERRPNEQPACTRYKGHKGFHLGYWCDGAKQEWSMPYETIIFEPEDLF